MAKIPLQHLHNLQKVCKTGVIFRMFIGRILIKFLFVGKEVLLRVKILKSNTANRYISLRYIILKAHIRAKIRQWN